MSGNRSAGDRAGRIGALIVEDDADVRSLIRILIESADNDLFISGEAANGREALEQLDDCDPQVVLLDHVMPGLSGIQTAARIRERRPEQPIVLCSAYLDDELSDQADAVGIDMFLPKERLSEIAGVLRRAARKKK